jgi:hypothetical protein
MAREQRRPLARLLRAGDPSISSVDEREGSVTEDASLRHHSLGQPFALHRLDRVTPQLQHRP